MITIDETSKDQTDPRLVLRLLLTTIAQHVADQIDATEVEQAYGVRINRAFRLELPPNWEMSPRVFEDWALCRATEFYPDALPMSAVGYHAGALISIEYAGPLSLANKQAIQAAVWHRAQEIG